MYQKSLTPAHDCRRVNNLNDCCVRSREGSIGAIGGDQVRVESSGGK